MHVNNDMDSSTSCTTSTVDMERIINYDQKIRNLEDQNNRLFNDNTSLRAQLQHVMELNSQKYSSTDENDQSKKQIKNLTSQLNSMKKKMKNIIDLRDNELSRKQSEVESANERYSCLQHSTNRELTKLRQKFNDKIDQMFKDNQKLSKEISKNQLKYRTIEAKIERLLKIASRKANVDFQNIDDVINALEENLGAFRKLLLPDAQNVQQPTSVTINKEILCGGQFGAGDSLTELAKLNEDLKSKNKCYKKKIEELNEELEKAIESGGKKNKQLTKELAESKKMIIEMQHELEKVNDDRVIIQENANHQVRLLETKVSSLKEELERNRKYEPYVLAQQPIAPQPYYPPETRRKTEDDYINEELQERIDELSRQVTNLTNERDESKSLLDKYQNDNRKLKDDIRNVCSEHDSLRSQNRELIDEVDKLKRDIIGKDKEIQERVKARHRNKKLALELQGTINSLLNTIEQQKKDIFDKQFSIDNYKTQIERLNREIRTVKDKCDDYESMVKNIPEPVIQLPPHVIEKPIPDSAWNIDGLPYELSVQIQDIGRSPSLMFHSKIQSAINKVVRYYQKHVKEHKKSIVDLSSKYESLKVKVNDFIVDLSVAIQGQHMTYKDFESGRVHKLISMIPDDCRDERNELVRTISDLQQELTRINVHCKTLFGLDDVHKALDHASSTIAKLESQTEHKDKLLKKTREAIPEKVIIDTTPDVEVLNRNIQLHESLIKQQKEQIFELQQQVREYEYKIEKLKREHLCELDNMKQNHDNEKAQIQNDMNEEIAKVTQTLAYTSDTLEDYKHQVSRLKNALVIQKQTITDLEQQKVRIESDFNNLLNEIRESNENERRELIEEYQKTVSDMSNKYRAQQLDMERIQKDLEYSERKRKQGQLKMTEARKEISKLNMAVADQAELFERERRLLEVNKNTSLTLAENEYLEKIQRTKEEAENKKKDIINLVADEFPDYDDNYDDRDEAFLRSLIKKVRSDIDRLQRTDDLIGKQ